MVHVKKKKKKKNFKKSTKLGPFAFESVGGRTALLTRSLNVK